MLWIELFTSIKGIQWLSYVILLDGLISDIFGVAIVLSVEYPKVQNFLRKTFDFKRASKIRQLRRILHEEQSRLRDDSDFSNKGDSHEINLEDQKQRELLSYLLFPNNDNNIKIKKIEYIANTDNPKIDNIVLKIDTEEYKNLVVENSELDQWSQRAINYSYYREGAKVIVLGFCLIFLSTLMEMFVFISNV